MKDDLSGGKGPGLGRLLLLPQSFGSENLFLFTVQTHGQEFLRVREPVFVHSPNTARVRSHAPSIRSHRGRKVVWPDFQPMRVPVEPVCIDLFRQNPVFTSLHRIVVLIYQSFGSENRFFVHSPNTARIVVLSFQSFGSENRFLFTAQTRPGILC